MESCFNKMKYAESLKKNHEFSSVYKNGKSSANRYLVLYKYKNNQAQNKLGISVSKKVGNSVIRSRVTRLIRESYRHNEEMIEKSGWDFVVIARSSAKNATYLEIFNALVHLLKQQKVWIQ